jgi:hypothetical protein
MMRGVRNGKCQWCGEIARRLAAPMNLREAKGPVVPASACCARTLQFMPLQFSWQIGCTTRADSELPLARARFEFFSVEGHVCGRETNRAEYAAFADFLLLKEQI